MTVSMKKKQEKNMIEKEELLNIPAYDMMRYLEFATTIIQDGRIEIFEDGFGSRHVDSSHVCMIKLQYGDCSKPEKGQRLAFEFKNMLEALKKAGATKFEGRGENRQPAKTCVLSLDSQKGRYSLDIGGLGFSDQPLDDATMASPPTLPKIELPESVEVDADEFLKSLEWCKIHGDLFFLRTDGEAVWAEVNPQGMSGPMKQTYAKMEGTWDGENTPSQASYSITYVLPLIKKLKGQKLTLNFGDNFPLKIECNVDLGYKDCTPLKVDMFLAPRVDSDY